MIKLIAITDSEFGVSKDGKIPWGFGADRKFFRRVTWEQAVIMGRETYFSLPKGPLVHRRNCVISSKYTNLPGAEVFNTPEDAVIACSHDAWIIGGASIYNYVLSHGYVDIALITVAPGNYHADKFIDQALLPPEFTTIQYDGYKIREWNFEKKYSNCKG